MDLGHIEGIACLELEPEGTAKGEAGLGHWRRALNGNVVETTAQAEEICAAVLKEIYCDEQTVRVMFRAERKRLRGTYCANRIVLYGHPRVATLLHELAHHVVSQRYSYGVAAHGKEFKKTFVEVFRAFGIVYGVDVNAAAMKAYDEMQEHGQKLAVGDIVIAKQTGREYRVTGFGRTRVQFERIDGRPGRYSAKAEYLKLRDEKPAPEPAKVEKQAKPVEKPVAKVAKVEKPEPKLAVSVISVGSKVENTRKAGSLWKVTEVTEDGKLVCEALTDDSRKGKVLPVGRVRTFAARTMKEA